MWSWATAWSEDAKLREKKYDTNSLNPSLTSHPCLTFKAAIHRSLNCHSPLNAPRFCFLPLLCLSKSLRSYLTSQGASSALSASVRLMQPLPVPKHMYKKGFFPPLSRHWSDERQCWRKAGHRLICPKHCPTLLF